MIEVQDVAKRFGAVEAVRGVSFTVNEGEIVGFLGPNGAGKTTTMRIVTGIFPPTRGTVRIAGHDVRTEPLACRRAVGYFPEHAPYYPELRVTEYLRFVARVKPRAGEHILDMAGGTGDIAFRMKAKGADVTVSDINPSMLEVGQQRARKKGLTDLAWSVQNAETLRFGDGIFDAYTIAFGIRNVTHIDKALAEAHRVLKRGGRFFCLEFSTTLWPGFADVYDFYSHKIVPKLGKAIAHDEESYRYLIESIRRFPDMERFKTMIADAGFIQAKAEPILGGLVAIHSGWKI